MVSSWFTVLSFASAATAAFHTNLNYASPSRRHLALGIDLPKVAKRSSALPARSWGPEALNFTHGVASGDPLPNSVILWTRVSPTVKNDASNVTVEGNVPLYNHETEPYIKASKNPVCVEYQVGADKNFTSIIDKGTAYTTSDIDYTVKVEATNLEPFTQYYYQFNVCGSSKKSPLGRTKSSPRADDDVTKVGLAVYSCSNYPNGYFNAYGNAARKDNIDYVIHLGDYIYETGKGTLGKDPRATNPSDEIFTLYDYRTRIAQYRTDLDLLLSHQQYPWIPVWDDHEVSNNGYRDGSSGLNNTEESFRKDGGVSVDQRKMNAVRAYFEWMPIRQVDMDDNLRIWRTFQIGKLFDLIMLDTRNYDRSITTLNWNDDYVAELIDDAGRTLMGSHQENWFYGQLSKSAERGATWRIIGNQIVFSRLNNTARDNDWLNADQWDGYTANRNRTLHHLYSNEISNTIFLSGDSHANWVSDLVWLDEMPYDQVTGAGSIGVEFAGTAVSSSGYAKNITYGNIEAAGLIRDNAELQWTEGYYRGYYELQISPSEITANYFGCPTVAFRNPLEISLANFTVLAGANRLQRRVANGTVENGALQRGSVKQTNLTLNTETGAWNVTHFNQMFIKY
ncbi:alkaline phosphatase [Paraphaeosphaeria sporulosa]|uniref:Alkaline phosphatase n=1 Tax=Paraphaeosphaeria sporulosa TaxID=1460663 RepID=A0A177CX76_9PLEO|nr:alkaline phosphatase [Paraphaeosphaeria sporulosa]OAG11648.1 alkaline phosphatase [Paraphaeosphaeria sporulosa]